MRRPLCHTLVLLFLLAAALPAAAQMAPRLTGCLSLNGVLYNVRPEGQLTEPCGGNDQLVLLGSGTIDRITAGQGLLGGGVFGEVRLELDPSVLMPGCAPGEVLVTNEQGAWVCALPPGGRPRNPGGALWVLPRLDFCVQEFSGGGGRVRLPYCEQQTLITIVNPGSAPARVSCQYFDFSGRFILLPGHRGMTLGPGATGVCGVPSSGDAGGSRQGMGLVVSDQEVLVTAHSETDRERGSRNFQVEAYAIDCRNPEGYEFVCLFATRE